MRTSKLSDAQLRALKQWALTSPEDRRKRTANARAAWDQKFYDEVDAACPGLPDDEREIRVVTLRRVYHAELARKRQKKVAAEVVEVIEDDGDRLTS